MRAIASRATAALAVSLAVTGGILPAAAAEPARRCRADVAQVRVEGRTIWCAGSREVALVTNPVWSRDGRAVAFATKDGRGALTLRVVLVGGDVDGHALSWAVPDELEVPRRGAPSVTWLGQQRVGFGFSAVRPALVASWRLRRW